MPSQWIRCKCHSQEQLAPQASKEWMSPNSIEVYESLSFRTGTNLVAEDDITIFPYYCSETIQEMIKMMNGYLRKYWVQIKEELKDAF